MSSRTRHPAGRAWSHSLAFSIAVILCPVAAGSAEEADPAEVALPPSAATTTPAATTPSAGDDTTPLPAEPTAPPPSSGAAEPEASGPVSPAATLQGAVILGLLDLKPRGVSPDLAAALTGVLALELAKFDGITIISDQEIRASLDQMAKAQLLGCDDDSCLVDIASLARVDKLIFGDVSQVGNTLAINISLIDHKNRVAIARSQQTLSGDQERLIAAVQAVAFNLIAAARGELEGRAISVGTVEDMRVAQKPKRLDVDLTLGSSLFLETQGGSALNQPGLSLRLAANYNLTDTVLVGLAFGFDSTAAETNDAAFWADVITPAFLYNRIKGKLSLRTLSGVGRVTIRKPFGLVLPYASLGAGVAYHDLNLGDQHVVPVSPADTSVMSSSGLRTAREDTSGLALMTEVGAGLELLFSSTFGLVLDARLFKSFHNLKVRSHLETDLYQGDEYVEDFQAIQGLMITGGVVAQW